MKPFYEDNKVTVLNGHVITELQGLPSKSVHCVVLSPPYWGLRDYGLPPQVWDDAQGCEHEWGQEKIAHYEGGYKKLGDGGLKDFGNGNPSQGQFCQKCNAWRGSLGLEPTPELYIQHLVQVFREIWRVARPDSCVFLNLGDSYAGYHGNKNVENGAMAPSDKPGYKENMRKSTVGIHGLKPKDLCGIPWRVALALQQDGWWLRSDIIWNKPNPMPESCTDRPTSAHEYVFLLSKSGTPKFWTHRDQSGTRTKPKADYRWVNQITDEEVDVAPPDWKDIIICPRCEGTGIAMIDLSCEVMGQWMEAWVKDKCPVCDGKKKVQKWKRINLWRGHDYFYDADAVREETQNSAGNRKVFRGHGDYTTQGKSAAKYGLGRQGNEIQGNDSNPAGRNLRSVWTIATQPFKNAHFATFPEKLVEPCIKAGTSEKGCCPECGAPWTRIIEKMDPEKRSVKSEYPGKQTLATSKYKHDETGPESKTIGWRRSCECLSDDTTPGPSLDDGVRLPFKPIPCTVLDCFGGSGRTAIVAKKLGRKCIIIELKPEYCSMPLDELRQENIF